MRERGDVRTIPRHSDGFSLVELAVALTLAGITALVVYGLFFDTQGAAEDTRRLVDAQSDVRIAMNLMVQDIRGSGASPLELPFARIAAASRDTIRVQSDLDGNGAIDPGTEPPEDVTWFHDPVDEALVRRTATGEFAVARDVTSFGLTYLDADGASLDVFPLSREDRVAARAVQLFVRFRVADGVERERDVTILLRNADPGV